MKKTCAQCKKESTHRLKRRLCSVCYVKVLNRERIQNINSDFKSPWHWNQFLWDRYTQYLAKRSYLNNSDPIVAKKLAAALQVRKLQPFCSWFDIFELRDKLCLGYSPLKNRNGCPITMLGHLLKKDGKLPARGQSHDFYLIFKWFPEPTKSIIKKYAALFQCRKSQVLGIKHLGHLRDFHNWLQGDFFKITEAQAQNYLLKIAKEKNTEIFRTELNSLKRFYRWSFSEGLISKNPFDFKLGADFFKICVDCDKMKIISISDQRCILCHIGSKIIPRIEANRQRLNNASTYNQYLFDIHLQYIKRYRITAASYMDANKLTEFLIQETIKPLRSWKDVRHAAHQFKKFMQIKSIYRGCPFIKIGHRLAELGVIPFIGQDDKTGLDRNLKKLPPDLEPIIRTYTELQLKNRRRHTTAINTVHTIRYFLKWLDDKHTGIHLFSVTEKMVLEYLEKLGSALSDYHRGRLHQFYKWCQFQGIAKNPFENIKSLDPLKELPICSKEQFKQLLSFIKNPESEPSAAFLLTLILFFAFMQKEILYSTYEICDDIIEISIFRSQLSYGHKEQNRRKVFLLPKQPLWFLSLQKRFLEDWQRRFAKLKNPSPIRPLFLAPNIHHNRPATPFTLQNVIKNATAIATGKPIPMRVLRMTAGHLHTYQTDASMLTELGWSRSQSFKYTWMPRKYWS